MENLSHSRNPNRSLPKKPHNNGGFTYNSNKTTYDDVFGGPTLSPRLEDYCEIFAGFNGSSRAAVSSIPVLDLPLVDDRDVYFDVRSHGFDYREVFGGFVDFAPSYEELFLQRSNTVADCDSSDGAWTPEEVESFSNGRDSYDSIDGCTEFSISYNKAGRVSESNISSGVIRVADLGHTVAVDEMVKETGPSSVVGSGRYAFEDGYNGAVSYTSEPFVTVSEIGLKTNPTGIPPPSRPAPLLRSNSRTTGSEGSVEESSPPFFDVEVDASSAAVRDAMIKAEAKMKNAKELFERKRDGGRATAKRSSVNSNDEGEEATPFVELVRTEQPRNADENSVPVDGGFFDQKLTWAANVEWEKQQRRGRGDREDVEAKKLPKHSGTRRVAPRHKRHEGRLAEKPPKEATAEKSRHVELQFEMGNDLPDHGEIIKQRNLFRPQQEELPCEEKTRRLQNQDSDNIPLRKAAEKNQDCVFNWEQNARKLREALGLAENESTLEVSLESNGNGKLLGGERNKSETKLNEALKRMEEETRIKEARVKEENDRREREAFEKAEKEKRLKAALEQEEREKQVKEACEKEENERRLVEVGAREKAEHEKRMKEQEEYELRLKEAFETEEKNRRIREAREKAEHERKMKLSLEQEKERKIKEAREKEEHEQRIKEAREKAEHEQRLKEIREHEEKERRIKETREREENERRAKEALEQAENERKLKEALEQKEKEEREKEEKEKKLKEAIELEEKEKRLIEAFDRAETERRLKEDLEHERKERENQEHLENEMKEHEYTREESAKVHRDACEMEKTCETTKEALGRQWSEESLSDSLEEEEDRPDQEQSRDMSDEACPWKIFEKNLKDASLKEGNIELDTESGIFERNENGESGKKSASVTDSIQEGKLEQNSKTFEKSKDASVLERDVGMKIEAEEKSEGVVVEEKAGKVDAVRDQRNAEEKYAPKTTSGFRNHENKFTHQQERGGIYESQGAKVERPLPSQVFLQREKEAERLKRERDIEMERLRKIEEEREREREREKDRMAFDQRALADARERLEKACAEAREKSLPDKVSMEARFRAERAAVERATTEARERAAEKAAFEARERMERSVSDKQFQSSGIFGERVERSVSDKHFRNSASFGASRFQNSPGTDGESPQRYTSRLERHRRTADRVAKALAEKNMRDLVAQREQAERIRISEPLDAEVKRWSSGKEGNIRALLSTLQYILGSESGWQPLPLTEVITSAAVKRAYRKATLCVHPDKLQQRGANIHQKYICEKVFDLLKEAWHRFNSEER